MMMMMIFPLSFGVPKSAEVEMGPPSLERRQKLGLPRRVVVLEGGVWRTEPRAPRGAPGIAAFLIRKPRNPRRDSGRAESGKGEMRGEGGGRKEGEKERGGVKKEGKKEGGRKEGKNKGGSEHGEIRALFSAFPPKAPTGPRRAQGVKFSAAPG